MLFRSTLVSDAESVDVWIQVPLQKKESPSVTFRPRPLARSCCMILWHTVFCHGRRWFNRELHRKSVDQIHTQANTSSSPPGSTVDLRPLDLNFCMRYSISLISALRIFPQIHSCTSPCTRHSARVIYASNPCCRCSAISSNARNIGRKRRVVSCSAAPLLFSGVPVLSFQPHTSTKK